MLILRGKEIALVTPNSNKTLCNIAPDLQRAEEK
jgi:hypothetical protein